MKKLISLILLVITFLALVACDSAISTTSALSTTSSISNTMVRVVGLSYSSSATALDDIPSIQSMKLLYNRLLADEDEEYIFPGDILTFTVELEDPNFELVALLAIKFNGQVIRANVDNSIVSTRDCGANICVDFPYEITADKSEYTVHEVKFAKTNIDGGVNAIIDNQSVITLAIDVYTDELFPYVLESVQTLNNAIQNMEYYNDYAEIDVNTWNRISVLQYSGRTFYINNYDGEMHLDSLQIISQEKWLVQRAVDGQINITQGLYLSYENYGSDYDDYYIKGPYIEFFFFEKKFKYAFFYNEGNSIYLDLLGERFFIIEMRNSMRIMHFKPLPYVS